MFYLQKNLAITDKHTCIHYSLCPLFAEDDQMILAPDILDSLAWRIIVWDYELN